MGVIGGCAGSLFININTLGNIVRRRYLTTKFSKVLECTIFCLLTSTVLFWCSYTGTCQYQDLSLNGTIDNQEYKVVPYKESYLQNFRGWCPPSKIKGQVLMNSIGTYYWASSAMLEDHAVHEHLHFEHIPLGELILFISFFYFFFLPSYGTNLPAGLFSPGIIMGITYGNIAFTVLTDKNYIGMEVDNVLKRKLMCIGCCSIISAYVRLKYSVCVILLEIW
jgi:H+/Cl- antiporter ClcA